MAARKVVHSDYRTLRRALACGAAILALSAGSALAQSRPQIDAPAQPLEQSLKDVARQTGVNILFGDYHVAWFPKGYAMELIDKAQKPKTP